VTKLDRSVHPNVRLCDHFKSTDEGTGTIFFHKDSKVYIVLCDDCMQQHGRTFHGQPCIEFDVLRYKWLFTNSEDTFRAEMRKLREGALIG
jgi:hypothetical protein